MVKSTLFQLCLLVVSWLGRCSRLMGPIFSNFFIFRLVGGGGGAPGRPTIPTSISFHFQANLSNCFFPLRTLTSITVAKYLQFNGVKRSPMKRSEVHETMKWVFHIFVHSNIVFQFAIRAECGGKKLRFLFQRRHEYRQLVELVLTRGNSLFSDKVAAI